MKRLIDRLFGTYSEHTTFVCLSMSLLLTALFILSTANQLGSAQVILIPLGIYLAIAGLSALILLGLVRLIKKKIMTGKFTLYHCASLSLLITGIFITTTSHDLGVAQVVVLPIGIYLTFLAVASEALLFIRYVAKLLANKYAS